MQEYAIQRTAPSAAELALMYQRAQWIAEPDTERLQTAVESQSEWFVARDTAGAVLGLGRFITDYVRYAFIVDVIVESAHQGAGIGTALMQAMLAECRSLGIDSVNLWPSKGKVPFYERLGFYALPPEQPHMKWRKE